MIAVFNVDSRLSVQLNLAHVAINFKKPLPFSFRLIAMKAARKE